MRVVFHLPNDDLWKAQAAAVACEEAGFDGIVALENAHGPFPPLAVAAMESSTSPAPGGGLRRVGDLCRECGQATLVYEEGCKKCLSCGFNEC